MIPACAHHPGGSGFVLPCDSLEQCESSAGQSVSAACGKSVPVSLAEHGAKWGEGWASLWLRPVGFPGAAEGRDLELQ